jgi:hypothetical protein
MAEFSQLRTLELWYRALWVEEIVASLDPVLRKRAVKRIEKERSKSRGEEIFPKLAEQRGTIQVIKDQLPTIFHAPGMPPGVIDPRLRDALAAYRATLPHASQSLLDRYELLDVAVKVVGIGSVRPHAGSFSSWRAGRPVVPAGQGAAPVLEPYAGERAEPRAARRRWLPAHAARQ